MQDHACIYHPLSALSGYSYSYQVYLLGEYESHAVKCMYMYVYSRDVALFHLACIIACPLNFTQTKYCACVRAFEGGEPGNEASRDEIYTQRCQIAS